VCENFFAGNHQLSCVHKGKQKTQKATCQDLSSFLISPKWFKTCKSVEVSRVKFGYSTWTKVSEQRAAETHFLWAEDQGGEVKRKSIKALSHHIQTQNEMKTICWKKSGRSKPRAPSSL
jgi:hypothetical protein